MGFRLNSKWGFPVRSYFLTNSPSRLPSSVVRGREASFSPARLSSLPVIFEEGVVSLKDSLKACTSCTSTQSSENGCSEIEELKVNFGKRSSRGGLVDAIHLPVGETKTDLQTVQSEACKVSQFSLLLENLVVLEETLVDSDVLRLEEDILLQLARLGALKVFNSHLSRTHRSLNDLDLSHVPTDSREYTTNNMLDSDVERIVVCSSKKKERKKRRKRALANPDNISSQLLPSNTQQGGVQVSTFSSAKEASNFKERRLIIARNEAEMSKGVKVVTNLERIRTTLEEETGGAVSLSTWAEAAGISEKLLRQHLRFGLYCRDELLRSTRSLVLYLARNYRCWGLSHEDIVQAGNLGVLQGAERFDHTRGYRFSTYVQFWIRKSMSKMVERHARGIQIPSNLNRAINQIQKARKALLKSHGKYPEEDEIAKFTGLSLTKVISATRCLRVVGSTDQKVGDSMRAKYLEFVPDMSIRSPEEVVLVRHMRKDVHELLKGLDSREMQVIILRNGINGFRPKSLDEIGKLLHVSKEWIRKIEKKAMKKLRNEEICGSLRHYLDLLT